MIRAVVRAGVGSWLALGCLLNAAGAKPEKLSVKPTPLNRSRNTHRIDIWNGLNHTVHYTVDGISPTDQKTLNDVDRAQSDLAAASRLQELRNTYIENERVLEARRFAARAQMGGVPRGYVTGVYPDEAAIIDANTALAVANWSYPYWGGYGYARGWPAYGYGTLGYPGYPIYAAPAALAAPAPIDDSPIKTEIAKTLVTELSPDYTARLNRNLADAQARVASSEQLRAALALPTGGIRPAGFASPGRKVSVTVNMKKGSPIKGTLVREDNEQVIVDTGKEEVEIRKSETTSIVKGKK